MTIVEYILFYVVVGCLVLFSIRVQQNKQEVISLEESYVIKGISMIFIVIAHWVQIFQQSGGSDGIITPLVKTGVFGVALFFFLSGYGLEKKQSIQFFWKKKLINLFIPYIVLSFVFNIIIYGVQNPFDIITFLTYLGLRNPLWFLAVLLMDYFFWWIDFKYIHKNKNRMIVLFVQIFIASMILKYLGLPEYWYSSNFTFMMGCFLGVKNNKVQNCIKRHGGIFNICTFMMLIICLVCNELVLTAVPEIGKNIVLCAFCLCVYGILTMVNLQSKVLVTIGKNTLYIYVVHSYILKIFKLNGNIGYPLSTIVYLGLIFIGVIISSLVFKFIDRKILQYGKR